MHDVVTTSSSTNDFFKSPETTRKATSLSKTTKSTLPVDWTRDATRMEDMGSDRRQQQINVVYSNQPVQPKFQTSVFLPSRNSPLDHNSSESVVQNGGRWRFNSNGQLVDPESETPWDLADELVRLKINNGINSEDDLHGQMRTPPKSKMAATGVVQLQESSPLETSSDASLDSGSSPHASDQNLVLPSHSRGSSTDTTSSSKVSGSGNTLQTSALGLNVGTEHRDRPHSFSGGLSSADLRRLQNAGIDSHDSMDQQWSGLMSNSDMPVQAEQTTYPSLVGYPRQQGHSHAPASFSHLPDDLQVDYGAHQRQYQPLADNVHGGNGSSDFSPRANNGPNVAPAYRPQPARAFNPQVQGMVPGTANVGYPAPPTHTTHLSLGNAQQLYDMMVPLHDNPAVARVQQQHNVFRATHQHSSSDPIHLREAAALLNGGLPPFAAPGIYPGALAPQPALGMYPSQFYPPQDQYSAAGVAAQVMAAARLQSQYASTYGVSIPNQNVNPGMGGAVGGVGANNNVAADPSGNGPSANNRKLGLYKTELCRSWEEKGTCRYGPKCQFAHGEEEIRKVSRHPKYKTEICRTFWVSGSCPYGKRCCFIHTELPASGAPPGADGAPPPKVSPETRSRSDSDSASDPPVSLLARISAKRNQDAVNNAHISELASTASFPTNSRPPTGALRVDTSSLDQPNIKQNKSAYPSFAANGVLFSNNENSGNLSPGPVTAGPDLGRQRTDFISFGQSRLSGKSSSNARHSFNGSDINLNFDNLPASGHASPFGLSATDASTARPGGHTRAGSVGNWASLSRSGHLTAPSPFHGPQSASPGNEARMNTPWLSPDVGPGSRYTEKAWV
ncbi:hypothetical protein EW146_g2827 [Bondarzewia mesenterica]|uniref:C3H1-type domain-containing protein n=1 Tax=Bondarzewia mesenterica TaxID=1095465 RepID=A0A4S4LZG5_9AGAM|nr:hypothetical protein EW146_g2827 [Bondarzewia mesenterica]